MHKSHIHSHLTASCGVIIVLFEGLDKKLWMAYITSTCSTQNK